MKKLFLAIIVYMIAGCSSFWGVKKWEIPKGKNFEKLRIRLDLSSSEVELGANNKITVFSRDVKVLEVNKIFQSNLDNLKTGERLLLQFSDKQFSYKSKQYRGEIELFRRPTGIQVVNIISLETYLHSVVPSEMPASWPLEALKAQAVAARTYAVGSVVYPKFDDYHMESDVKSQMYSGISRENKLSTKAVEETKGQILVSNNQIVQAFYHSNSGGVTETPDMVWGTKLDYLVSVPSEYCKKSEAYEWKVSIDKNVMQEKLAFFGVLEIEDIQIKEKTPSGRAKTIEIKGKDSSVDLKAQDFRMKISPMKIRSLLFSIRKEKDQFLLQGYGFGHGVGMSQWGAFNMAKNNFDYKDILLYYYKNIELLALPD